MRSLVVLSAVLLIACGGATSTGPTGLKDPWATVFVQPFWLDSTPNGNIDPTVYYIVTTHAVGDPGNPDPGSVPPSETVLIKNKACYQAFNGNNSSDVRLHFSVTITAVRYNGGQVGNTLLTDTLAAWQSESLDPSPDSLPFPAPWGLEWDHPLVYKLRADNPYTGAATPFAADTLVIRTGADANGACDKLWP